MKFLVVTSALVLACTLAGWAQTPLPDLKTVSGKVYKSARVSRVEPDGITYFFAGGVAKVPFTDLTEAVQKQYGYNAAKATAFAKADEEAQTQIKSQMDTVAAALKAKQEREAKLQNLAKLLAASKLDVRAKISSIENDGVLARIMLGNIFPATSGRDGMDIGNGMRWWNTTDELQSSVFIKCKPNAQAVDGDIMFLTVYPCGIYDGYGRKKCYTTDVVEATQFISSNPHALEATIAGRTDWAPAKAQ